MRPIRTAVGLVAVWATERVFVAAACATVSVVIQYLPHARESSSSARTQRSAREASPVALTPQWRYRLIHLDTVGIRASTAPVASARLRGPVRPARCSPPERLAPTGALTSET